VTLLGAKGKGYGGLNLRPAPSHAPREFTTQLGPLPGDADAVASPWADLTYTPAAEADERGVAIFQHPANPDYPHPGWVLRHYGFLGASWPALDPYVIAPGDSVTLRYRVYIHRGDAEAGGVAEAFAEFAKNPF
jgi:hypothetical protein